MSPVIAVFGCEAETSLHSGTDMTALFVIMKRYV